MNAAFAPIAERYHYLNQYASQGQIIFFGSSYLDQFPIYELKEDYGMDQTIFKRTIPGLKIEDAFALLDSCVFDLMPSKLFLCFGDDDAESPSFSLSDFMNQYRKLVVRLQNQMPKCEIYLLSFARTDREQQISKAVQELAHEYRCEYIPLSSKKTTPYVEDFRHIKVFLHPKQLHFSDAWSLT